MKSVCIVTRRYRARQVGPDNRLALARARGDGNPRDNVQLHRAAGADAVGLEPTASTRQHGGSRRIARQPRPEHRAERAQLAAAIGRVTRQTLGHGISWNQAASAGGAGIGFGIKVRPWSGLPWKPRSTTAACRPAPACHAARPAAAASSKAQRARLGTAATPAVVAAGARPAPPVKVATEGSNMNVLPAT